MIDLHVHTSMSDGTVSPHDLVRLAAQKGLQAIAITDHDSVAGVAPAQHAASSLHLEVVAGVEISTKWPSGTLHILGYFVNPQDSFLLSSLEYLRGRRIELVPKIIAKLQQCNMRITSEDVMRQATGSVPGKPHVAQVMVNRGYVHTTEEAFDLYLKKDRPAYVEKVKLLPREALKLISDAGGLAVLAHPYSLEQEDSERLEEILRPLICEGLQGIEAYSPKHTRPQTTTFLELASKLDLVVSGGTDFHGSNKPEIQLGVIPGAAPLSYSILGELKRRAQSC